MGKRITVELSAKAIVVWLLVISVVGVGGWLLYQKYSSASNGPIPQKIANQLDFTPMVMGNDAANYTQASFDYANVDSSTKVLSFIITTPGGKQVTASEYPQPPQFYEIPDYKTKFLENKSEATVVTNAGVINLSHPDKDKGKQIGLMLENGLIIFFNPDTTNLTQSEWHDLGNNLITQPIHKN